VEAATAPSVPQRPGAARRPGGLEPLLVALLERGGSDLHLTTGEPPRARVDGELEVMRGYDTPNADELRAMVEPVTPPKNREEFAERHDTDFGFALAGRARFRVNLFRDHCGLGAVFRQIPMTIPSAEDLRLPPAVAELSDLSRGLVLVTGPTGSGKSTTLAAIIDRANRTRSDHIITIEDPIEFVHASKRCLVHQREVGTHTGSFAAALRAALREDPDVVLVGEMRDLETTRVAIETAETGHLVFGTLHTTSAAATVERLINQYPEGEQAQIRLMLAGTLKAVVAQTLLKKIGGGRVAAYEVLLVTPALSNLIREGKAFQIPSMMQTGRGRGMVLLDESLFALVKEETVTAEEAIRKANDKKELANRLRAAGLGPDGADEVGPNEERPRLHMVG
jgi:twitching motility protein PilT